MLAQHSICSEMVVVAVLLLLTMMAIGVPHLVLQLEIVTQLALMIHLDSIKTRCVSFGRQTPYKKKLVSKVKLNSLVLFPGREK